MKPSLRGFRCFAGLVALISAPLIAGAEFPTFNLELAFFPTADGEPVAGGQAFTRNYTLNGPVDGGLLLPGMRLEQGPRLLYAAQPHSVYQYDPDTRTLQTVDTTGLVPEVSWPMGITHDTRLGRMVLVTLGGEGILYNYVIPDPTNAPSAGLWSFLGSMENKDVDAIAYLPSTDTLYAVGFSYGPGMPAKIFRIAPDGTHLGEIPLPELPYDISLIAYQAELIPYGDYLVMFLEPRPGTNPAIKESRIYLINPATYEVHLTYQRAIEDASPDTTGPLVQMRTPSDGTNVALGVPIVLSASASDTGGVQRVEFYNNGSHLALALLNTGSSNIYSYNWTTAPLGTNQVLARAVDNAGNIGTSTSIRIIVNNTNTPPGDTNQPDTTPPVVEMLTPPHGTILQAGQVAQLSARAVDARSRIELVEFLRNGVLVARGSNSRLYPDIFNFAWSNAPLGTNILSARATDSSGNVGTSAPVRLLVVSNSVPVPTNRPPIVRLTHPEPKDVFPLGTIRLTASATDPDGSVTNVAFFIDNQPVGARVPTNGQTTFFVEWTPTTNGTYEIFVRATDDDGRSSSTPEVRIRVGPPPQNDRISAHRSLPEEFRPGHPFEVKIDVEASRGVRSWRIEDVPPAGWRVIGISHGGKFDRETGTVKFGPFNKDDRTLRYHLISSKTNVGTFHFSGNVIADGVSSEITGEDDIRADLSHRKVKIGKGKWGKWVLVIDPDDAGRLVVEYRDSLTGGEWLPLDGATVTIDANGQVSIDDPAPVTGRRFYRIRFVDTDE